MVTFLIPPQLSVLRWMKMRDIVRFLSLVNPLNVFGKIDRIEHEESSISVTGSDCIFLNVSVVI